ncbi:tRNA (guanine(9)-N(1))-methyltransferase [Ascosphaera atra]|nr:tRNA (guanine(9)-N(1))-methyltransferase [Ascosphaera atra]
MGGFYSTVSSKMEDSERPRKLQKTGHEEEEGVPEETEQAGQTGQTAKPGQTQPSQGHEGQEEPSVSTSPTDLPIPTHDANGHPLSKNQLKKLRKEAQWRASRATRRKFRKEKEKARKQRRRAALHDAIAKGEVPASAAAETARRDAKRHNQKDQRVQLPVSIVLDCGYDDLMLDKERISLSSQIARCYSDNSRAKFRAHLFVSSFDKKLKERFDTVLCGHYRNWKGTVTTGRLPNAY